MKRSILLILALCLLITGVLAGCGKDKETITDEPPIAPVDPVGSDNTDGGEMRDTLVYYQDDLGYLVPVMLQVPWEEGIAKAALNKLKPTGGASELLSLGLNALLPDEVQILGLDIVDGLAKVDFSSEINNCTDVLQENNMVQGVVLTLTAFPTIDKVQIMIDGQVVDKLKHGTKIGSPISKVDINLEKATSASADGTRFTLYFYNTSASLYDYAIPVTRITGSSLSSLDAAMNELVNGPLNSGMESYLPGGITYIGSQMQDGITYLGFSEEFENLKEDPVAEKLAIRSILLTASEFDGVEDVVITVNGEVYDYDTDIPTFANIY